MSKSLIAELHAAVSSADAGPGVSESAGKGPQVEAVRTLGDACMMGGVTRERGGDSVWSACTRARLHVLLWVWSSVRVLQVLEVKWDNFSAPNRGPV